jgi:hypothetical protein
MLCCERTLRTRRAACAFGDSQVPESQEKHTTVFGAFARSLVWFSMLWPVAAFAAVTPYPPYPGAKPSPAFKVTVDG